MFKFISGEINTGSQLVKYLILSLDNTKVPHCQIIEEFKLQRVRHAGYVDISEQGFLSFYGQSISIAFDAKGIDVMEMNNLVKEHPFLQVEGNRIDELYISGGVLVDTLSSRDYYIDTDEEWTPLALRELYKTNLVK